VSIVGGYAGPVGRTPRVLLIAAAVLLLFAVPATAVPGTPGTPAGQGAGPGTAAPDGKPGKQEEQEPVWVGVPGTNLAHDTYGYPYPAAPDCDESNVASGGCVGDDRGFFQGQCTSWVAYRLAQRNGISFSNWFDGVHWGNASEWAKVAKGLGYQRNKVPAAGAIGWYARGHVSYVEEVYPDGGVLISEMNTDGHNGFHLVTVYPGSAGYPDRFLHLADIVPVDYTAPGRPSPVSAQHLDRGVSLTWRAPADDVGVAGYRVLRNGVPLAETTRPSYVDRQASPGQNYDYSVVAHDAAGNVSEPAGDRLGQSVPVTGRRRGALAEASEVSTATGSAVCGRLGTERRQHVACRVRTLTGWTTVRSGREIPWGLAGTRAFVASPRDTRVWFCRELPRGRSGCVPLDLASLSWGFDRVDESRRTPEHAVWKATATGPVRCGMAGDLASCTVLKDSGWKGPRKSEGFRPGDPLSRAFVTVDRGVAFCRTIEGHATCTTLDTRRMDWGRTHSTGRELPHGRWASRRAGPTLCVPGADCRVVAETDRRRG
jgi:hypothetical protein